MDAVTIVGLISNIISFIDFGSKFVKEVREIYASASGATGDALSHGLIAAEMRQFANDLVPSGQAVNRKDKAICDLAKECKSVAEDILKLLDKIKPKGPRSGFRIVHSAIKGLWYEKDISNLQDKLEKCRSQLGLQLHYVTSSEIKDQLKILAKNSREGGSRILMLQRQMQELHRTVETSDLRLRQGVKNLLQLSDDTYTVLITQRLLDSLRFDEMDGRFQEVARAHEKTFGWIYNSHHGNDENSILDGEDPYRTTARKSFRSWLTDGHGIFHISGKLGSGKSTLMKFLYTDPRTHEMLRKWAGSGTLVMASFFFYKPGSQLQKSTTGLFRSLLYQTLSKVPSLVPKILPEQWKEIRSIPWQAYSKIDFSPETLQGAFLRLIEDQSEDLRICFFIDGLDEREEMSVDDDNWAMVNSLCCWCRESSGRTKICVSSREYNVFMEHFPAERRIRMQDLTQEDMRIYIRDRTRFIQSSDRSEHIIDSIYQKADGIFLWVALVTRRLNDLHENGASWEILRRELDHAPQGLSDLFDHILQSLDPSDRKRAYQTFAMMRKASECEFPLLLSFYYFIDYYTGDPDTCDYARWGADNMSERDRIVQARKKLMGYCGGLAEVDPGRLEDPTISFTHRSVPEFLDSMRTEDMERSLRGFCAEDALSQLMLAYLWARDPSECENYPDRHYRWLSLQSHRITKMRKEANIGKAPFIFEEQLELALVRLGVRSITEEDNYKSISLSTGVTLAQRVATFHSRSARKTYYICSPYLVAAYLGNVAYVLWKVTHDTLVTCSPLQRILLFYCILYSRMEKEDSMRVRRILDILLEKGLGPQTTTNVLPGFNDFNYLDLTVWQHLILHFLKYPDDVIISSRSILWKWALDNKADPHFEIKEIQMSSHGTTLILGKDKRRLDGFPFSLRFCSFITSDKYADPEGSGIRVKLIGIINEKKFENREQLIALVERNIRLLQNDAEGIEEHTDKGSPEEVSEKDSTPSDISAMLPASEMDIESIAQKQSSYETKRNFILVYILGSIMAQKFYDYIENPDDFEYLEKPLRFEETWFFFYGTLMDPKTLARVLSSKNLTELRPATIHGYKTMLWGKYPALVDASSQDMVRGVVCKIKSEEEVNRLEAYETHMYYRSGFIARLDDDSEIWGEMFIWGGDPSHLREGSFNLQDWLRKQEQETTTKESLRVVDRP
ncbi:hypothetical protein CNMCM5793_006928 [Aspergillus hiratsukae]|uniref:NACHT domain-containing protein n=1 Tax=Aspergillus hiratsukae TaxID=1194566 RepID=A0A8H6UBP2_9EURO|nr:hypothetical protein CNMCM5793_006928 [Aspergillus hiratsukae]KAF7158523.1 hypothetical protein CNMCM6106_005205 [Aspergillus hiratsukae]